MTAFSPAGGARRFFDRAVSFGNTIAGRMKQAHVPTFAAAAVYHMFIALPPLLMLLVSLIRYLPVTQEDVLKAFSGTLPEQALSIIDSIASSIFNSDETTTIISSLLLLVSASGSMRSLMKGLDEVYGVDRKQHFLVFAAWAVLYTLMFLAMILLSLVLLVYGSSLLEYVRGLLKNQDFLDSVISFVQNFRYLLWGVLLTPVFMFFYCWLPAGKRKLRRQWPGALFSALAWALFSWGYSIYVSVSNKFGAYGYLGTIMVVMMWLYYCLMFFLLGGCLNVYLAERRKEKEKHSPIESTHQP